MKNTIKIKKSKNVHAWSNQYVGDQLIASIDMETGIAEIDYEENSLAQLTKVGYISGHVYRCDYELAD